MLTDTDTHAFFPDSGTDESRCLSGLLGVGCGGVHPCFSRGLLAAWLLRVSVETYRQHRSCRAGLEAEWGRLESAPLPLSAHEELARAHRAAGVRAHEGRAVTWLGLCLFLPGPLELAPGPVLGAWQVAALCCLGLLLLVVWSRGSSVDQPPPYCFELSLFGCHGF